MNELINYKAVCRTAPATPGLLIINRPGVTGAVLQSSLSLIDSFIHSVILFFQTSKHPFTVFYQRDLPRLVLYLLFVLFSNQFLVMFVFGNQYTTW